MSIGRVVAQCIQSILHVIQNKNQIAFDYRNMYNVESFKRGMTLCEPSDCTITLTVRGSLSFGVHRGECRPVETARQLN